MRSPHITAVLCMFGPVDASHSSWTVQCLISSTMNAETRLRLEFILYNGPHKLAFESWWMQVTAAGPGLFQCLISSTMNGETRLRWEFILYNGPHKL
eukprot:scaffold25195_cov121-Cyclotella_meneghiniana.AAC.1